MKIIDILSDTETSLAILKSLNNAIYEISCILDLTENKVTYFYIRNCVLPFINDEKNNWFAQEVNKVGEHYTGDALVSYLGDNMTEKTCRIIEYALEGNERYKIIKGEGSFKRTLYRHFGLERYYEGD